MMDKKDTQDLLRALVISKKGKYELRELLKDFREETGHNLPCFGYKTPLDFLKSVPDTIKLEECNQKVIIKPVYSPKSSHIASLVKRENLIKRNTFPPLYKTKFGEQMPGTPEHELSNNRIDKKKENKNNLKAITDSLTNKCKPKFDNRVNCKLRQTRIPCDKSSYSSDGIELEDVAKEESNVNGTIIKNLNDLSKLNLQNFARIGQYIEVCISVICNPHNFTLQLRRFKNKLKYLMIEMQLFYSQNGEKYTLTDSVLKYGLLCAALCKINSDSYKWYRAIILEHRKGVNAVVGLIDYGTITETDINHVKFLHSQFGTLPPQALSGHLANLRPFSGDFWSEESINRFKNLVHEKELVAGIVDIDYEENWLSVALTLTNEKDIHISDTLVDERLADFNWCDSASHICLPWNTDNGYDSLTHPITEFWSHPKSFVDTFGSKKECSKSHRNELFFSYSESNVRLYEMFAN